MPKQISRSCFAVAISKSLLLSCFIVANIDAEFTELFCRGKCRSRFRGAVLSWQILMLNSQSCFAMANTEAGFAVQKMTLRHDGFSVE